MKYVPLIWLLLTLFSSSCKPKAGQPGFSSTDSIHPVDTTQKKPADTNFIPVADLLRSDLKRIDSFAGALLKRTTINGRQDSAWIKPQELHKLAAAFFAPDIELDVLRSSYTENSFMDETSGFLQFIYTPKNPHLSIRSLVVYVDPNSTSNSINRIYMEREQLSGDTAIREKLTWTIKKYFYKIEVRQVKNAAPSTKVEKVIWDPAQYTEE